MHRLAIVGGGPLCTYAIERLAALLNDSDIALHVAVFDRTGRFGAGATHSDGQAPTSYMNRVASQIAFAADESSSVSSRLLPPGMRPTFAEWAEAKFRDTGNPAFDVRPADIPRRFVHGQALREMFDRYVSALRGRSNVVVDLRPEEVTDIAPQGGSFRVSFGERGETFTADHILLVTGHSRNRVVPGTVAAKLAEHGRYVDCAYPLDEQITLDIVPPGSAAGVLGMGLTAIDVLLHLTEGRGGTFGDRGGYVASGREPAVIVPVSPSGMFPWCRPENEKAADPSGAAHASLEHRAVFLTAGAIRALRQSVGVPTVFGGEAVRQLDFERHLVPLIVLEMAYVVLTTRFGKAIGPALRARVSSRYDAFLTNGCASRDEGIDALLEPLSQPFDWRALFDPIRAESGITGAEWRRRLVEFMRSDNADAAEGNLHNPVKAACDGVWRDQRSVLSAAVDFGGLTPESQRRFADVYFRYYTRMSNGIGLAAMRKVLALIEAGIIDVSIGPGSAVEPLPGSASFALRGTATGEVRVVDVVIDGRAHPFDVEHDAGPLYPNLFRRGLVRRWKNGDYEPGGLDVTRAFHPIGRDGAVEPRITILGAPLEGGVAYFQLSAARPRSDSAVLQNVARWANAFVESIGAGVFAESKAQ